MSELTDNELRQIAVDYINGQWTRATLEKIPIIAYALIDTGKELYASQSRLKVYREALEKIRAKAGQMSIDAKNSYTAWLFVQTSELEDIARAALSTNPSLEEETK